MSEKTENKAAKVTALITKGLSKDRALKKVGMAWVTYQKATAAPKTAAVTNTTDIATLEEVIRSNLTTKTKITLARTLLK